MASARITQHRTTRAVFRLLRVTLVVLSTELLSTCAEAPTDAPHPGFGMLAVAPIFPSGQLLAGVALDRVRLVIVRPQGGTLLDRTYDFSATQRQLTLSESLLLQASSEQLQVTLSFLSGATQLFTGSADVVVRQGPAGPPVEISLRYVGPGTQIARLTLEPRDTVLTFGASLPFRVTAVDSEGLDVSQFYVSWTSSDPSQAPDGAGVLKAGNARKVLRITAAIPTPTGARDSTTVIVVPPPARIGKTAGDAQTGQVGTRLPQVLEVEVLGGDDLPVPGVAVAFATTGGGAVDSLVATTDSTGRARTGATLGPTPGSQDFTASVAGAGSVSFRATATQVTTPSLSFTAAAQTVSEGVGTATITAQLSSTSSQAVTVPFTVSGTATAPADYSISASPLTIPAGSTTATVTVTVVADGVAEPDETVILTLGTPTNATLGATTVHTVTITGQVPTVSFTAATQTVTEGVGTATITAQLSSPSSQAVTVPFTVGGTATTPADYTISASPLTIPAGSTTGTITVTVVADGVSEPDETVIVTLGTPTNAALGATPVHTMTITGQVPTVSFTAAAQTVSEGVGTATITAQLSSSSSQPVTVPFTVSGTAISPADYSISASPLTIPAGSTSGTITVTVVADAVAEPNETVVVTMGTPINAAPGATTGHTLTIAAQVPTVSFTAATQTVSEGTVATITAQLSEPSTQPVTVPFTVGGTATTPADYTISASPLTIPAGSTTATVTVTAATDGVAEPDESVIVTLGTPTNATLGATTVHTVNIAGIAPAVSFTAAAQTVSEGVGTATITAQLSSPSTLPVTVPFTLSGTAASPADYTISASPLTIPAGSTTGSVTVTVVADGVAEPDETVIVTLGTPTNAVLGATPVHTLTIAAQTPAVSFTAAAQSVSEGVGTATITAQLSSPSSQAVTVPFTVGGTATSPADYTISASPLTIPAGSTTGSVTVTVVADAVAEPDETVIVTLGTPTNATLGATPVHTLTITGQTPTVSLTAAAQTVGEGVGTATITAQLSSPSSQAVTVPFTVGGTATDPADYTISASPITIPAGSTTGTITVTVVADGVAEPDETVIVTLGTPTNAALGATPVHTLTIAAQTPTVSFTAAAQSVSEGVGTATITAQLSSPSSQAVTVPFTVGGTAINPDDYSISASPLTIPAGSTTATVTVTVVADAVAEPDETVIVTLGTPTNATLGTPTVHTLTIAAQTPTVSFTAASQTVSEGTVATITAQLSSPSTQAVTVPFTVGGTAINPDDYSISASPITIPAGSTTGTVTVTVVTDGVAEPTETVVITMAAPTGATLGATPVHTVNIAGLLPAVSFTAAAQSVSEGVGTATITAQLSSPSSQAVTVPFTVGGTATDPADYSISGSPITIPAGSTTGTVTVTVVTDGVAEPDETVVVTLGAPTNAVLGTPTVHSLTIAAQTPTVSLTAATQTVSEGVGTATITAQLSSPSSQAVTVPFTVGGTAINPDDYSISASPITIPAGSTTGTVTITVAADGVAEPDETVIVTLGSPTNATLGATTVHTLTIAAQALPTVSFTAAAQTGTEGAVATITAQLSSPSSQAVTLPFTLSGTATSGADYTITTSPLTIPAGSTSGTITVTVAADGVAEPDETVIVTLGTPTNATLGTTTAHTLTIAAQALPTVSFTAAAQTGSEGAVATITAQLSGPSSQAVTVPFTLGGTAVNPADYTISGSPLTIAAGSTSATITVTVVADGVAEPDETVIVTLGTPTNATLGTTPVHTLTIAGQPLPTVSFTTATQSVSEAVGTATITAQLSSPSSQAVTLPFTLGGTATTPADYTITATPLTIPAGSTTGTVTVTVVADAVAEPDETVIVTLGAPTNATLGATTVHTLTIAAQTPTVSFTAAAQSVSEGVGTATITAQLSSPSTQAVTLPFTLSGTATSGADYTITTSPITIPAGSTTGTVTVTVLTDGVAEPDETVIVTLGSPTNATLGATTVHTLTIAAQTPTVSFSAAAQTGTEGAVATITAQLSSPSSQAVTLPFTLSGTATSGSDYTITTSPITIPAGSTTGTITVTVAADGVAEPDETVIVTLGSPTNATLGATTVHTLTITAQTPTVSFTAAAQSANEGTVATITAQLSQPSTQTVTVPFTVGGTAINPADYTISATPLTIPAGSTTGSVTVTVVADGVTELDETVIVTLGTPTNATLGTTTVHTLTIAAQPLPTVSFTAAAQTGTEGTVATITAQLSTPSTLPVTLPFTLSGTATSGADYTITTSPITIPAGSTTGTITVTVAADGVAEPDETVIVTLGSPTNATLGASTVHTLTIPAQAPPTVSFTAAAQTGSEGAVATITAQLSGPSSQAVTLPFTVTGTAANGTDYTITASPLTIAAGSTTGTISVTVAADGVSEPSETVVVTLGTPTNATLGATTVHTLTIPAQVPVVNFTAASQTASEGTVATITAQLSEPSTQAVTLPFTLSGTAASGSDYTITTSPITIAAGSTTGTITVTVAGDGVAEPSETVVVTLGTPTNATLGATTVHTLTIPAQVPAVNFTAASQTVSEGTVATITAQLSQPSTQTVTLPFTVTGTAANGSDYTITASPITIAAGSTTGTITVTVAADGVAEPDETVIATLGTPTNATLGATTVHTLTIAGQTPTVSFTVATQTATEGAVATITAQLSQPSTQAVTVPFSVAGTATSGTDYTITGSPITIPAGSTSGSINVTLAADGVAEPNETVIVTLGSPTNAILGAITGHTLTIAGQTPTVSFTAANQTGTEGTIATITAQLNQPSTQTVTLPFTLSGTAASGADYTITASPITIAAGSTTGTISVTVVADGVAEPDETVIVTLGTPTNATLGATTAHTLTIPAQVPAVNFTVATQSAAEGTVATITAQLSQPSTQAVTLPFTLSGTAASGADYTITASPITIAAGSTTGTISVTVVADGVAEPSETVVVTLGTPTNATLGATTVHTLTIPAQALPVVNFTAASQTAAEGTVATITAQLSGPSSQAVTLPFTLSGTATSGSDYTITASPITIAAGSTTGTINVTIVADGVSEPDETVVVTMGTPTNATPGTTTVHTLTIAAPLPTVSFTTAAQTVNEAVGSTTITVQISSTPAQPVIVPFTVGGTATSGADYTITPASSLTFAVGTPLAQTLTVTVVNSPTGEPNETVVVTLGTPTNATLVSPSVHTITITDNNLHPPVLSNLSFVLIAAVSSGCDVFGGPLGAEYQYQFSYSDAGGDVIPPGATDSLAYHFHPSEIADGFVRTSSTYAGTGSSGTISNSVCFLFEGDTSVDVSLFVTDVAGNLSAPVSANVPKPVGANIVGGPQPLSARGRSPAALAVPR
jgi:hypothetical protein